MLLTTFVLTKDINAIEIRLVNRVRSVRTTLLENQPASRPCFARRIFVAGVAVLVAVESLPRNKLASGTIEDDVARHWKFDLLAVNPTSRWRRSGRRKSHFVPKLIRIFVVTRILILSFGFR